MSTTTASIRPPLLLTSSVVAHDTDVALKDTEERQRLTMDSLGEWMLIDPALQIVICDGSGFDFTNSIRQRFPSADVECLFFQNDLLAIKRYGRGYGEGEIVRHALEHSRLITYAGCFAKCSAKLWVKNYRDCLSEWNGKLCLKGVFLDVFSPSKPTTLAYIDTRFYISQVKLYKELLLEAHVGIDKDKGYGLEECFLDCIHDTGMHNMLWRTPPIIEGVGGGIGAAYRNSVKRNLKEKLRSLLVQHNHRFADLFLSTQNSQVQPSSDGQLSDIQTPPSHKGTPVKLPASEDNAHGRSNRQNLEAPKK